MSGNELLDDILNDLRGERKFLKKLCAFLCAVIVVLIVSIVAVSIHYQNKLFKFIGETEIMTSIDMNNKNSTNYGNINTK